MYIEYLLNIKGKNYSRDNKNNFFNNITLQYRILIINDGIKYGPMVIL